MRFQLRLQWLCVLIVWALPWGSAAAESPDALFAANRFTQAKSAYLQAIKRQPQQVGLRLGLIRALFRLDLWQEAGTEAEQLVGIAPQDGDAHGMLSLTLMRQALTERAADEAKRALALNPASYWGLLAMGRVQIWDYRLTDAQATLHRAAALHPDWPEAWYLLVEASSDDLSEQSLRDSASYVRLAPKGHPHTELMETLPTQLDYLRQFLHDPPYSAVEPLSEERLAAADRGEEKDAAFTLPIQRRGDYVILPVKIGLQELHVLFDTGGGFEMTLDKSAIAKLHLPVLYRSIVRGVSGAEPATLYKAARMQIGDQIFQSIPIEGIANKVGDFDGIFGVNNFDHYAVTIDFEHNSLILARGKNAVAPAAADGNRLLTVPFHYLGGDIFVRVTVGGKDVWAVVDTGADAYAILSLRFAREIAAGRDRGAAREARMKGRMGIGASATSETVLLFNAPVSLAVGARPGQQFRAAINPAFGASPLDEQVSPSGDFEVRALLGISFLTSARRVTFDYPHRLLTLELPADKLPEVTGEPH